MTAMSSMLKVFYVTFLLLALMWSSCGQENQGISDVMRKIFLSKQFNSTAFELILNSARESFLYLRDVEKQPDVNEKLNFAKNYANFLLKLFNELQTKDVDIYELFSKENSFLKGYDPSQISSDFNITELKAKIEELEFAAEQHLVSHCNSSNECLEASQVLTMNKTSFDAFLKEKRRADFGAYGYFFLEIFATVIGLSWGVISSVIYYAESAVGVTNPAWPSA